VHRVRVDKSFRYQMQAGDGNTAWHTVQAVDPPTLAEVQFVVESPSYVARPRLEKTHIPSRLKVMQGSRLFLRMRPATPLARCELAFTGESSDASSKVISLKPNTEGWYHFETLLEADLTFAPHLWNEHGLTNDEATTCRIQVIPDQAPVARILGSNSEAAVANDDVVKIEFEAHDDQGIASAQLIVYDESGVEKGEPPRILHIQDIPLGNQELQQHVLASLELDLKKLNLAAGSQISYAIRVMDNRMLNLDPQHPSPPLVADRDEETPTDSNDTAPSSDPRQPRNKSTPGGKRSQGDNMMRELAQKDDGNEPDHVAMNEEQTTASKTKNASQTDDADGTPSESSATTGKDGLPSTTSHATTNDALQPDENGDTAVSALFPENVLVAGRENDEKSIATTGNPSPSQPARAGQPKRSNGTTESATTMLAVRPDQKNADGTATSEKDGADNSTPDKNTATAAKSTPASQSDASVPSEQPNATAKKKAGTKSSGNNNAENPVRIVVRNAVEPSNTDNKDDPTADPNVTPPDEHPSSNKERQTFLVDMVNGQQDAETRRRRLRITERQAAIAAAKERQDQALNVREQVVEIDRRLDAIEKGLTRVVDRQIPDADRPQHLQQLDQRLGEVEKQIANLRSETREGQFAFVGLQMVDIGRTHVTPARERVFVALREPDVGTDRNSTLALQSVLRARELLAALLARYDRVAQDQKLADALEESAKMYEIYIEKAQSLMREARQTRNPLERKMEILDLDQDYLDRAAEVQRLRREMLAEFARVLGDDPRLLSRYLQLTKNRRDSLRDQLSHVAERQTDIAAEVRGWVQVQEDQRNDLFNVMVETRLQLATPLAKDAAELAEHVEKQLPLVLEPIQGTAEAVVKMARDLSATARDIALDVRRQLRNPEADIPWKPRSHQLGSL
ncbi:MAG: hypothetical protein Q8K78_08660, partial [Planctomycetaceae bacterium]|nr:hypothetical protein [Planctomycetaceae bacterium]